MRFTQRFSTVFCWTVLLTLGLAGCGGSSPPTATSGDPLRNILGGDAEGFARISGPQALTFPHDHGPHPDTRTEWWYWTGDLRSESGERFGFQWTVFRFAVSATQPRPAASETPGQIVDNPWASQQVMLAHVALTDVAQQRFYTAEHQQRVNHVALAGWQTQPFSLWCGNVRISASGAGFHLLAPRLTDADHDNSLAGYALTVLPTRPIVLQGDRGYSRKGADPANASMYYSWTRMAVSGTVHRHGQEIPVTGLAWMDREWSTSSLDPDTVGWDWLSLHLDTLGEVMLYRLRTRDGGTSPWSAGTWQHPDGQHQILTTKDFSLNGQGTWQAPGGEVYPRLVDVDLGPHRLRIMPVLQDQVWRGQFRYWEGLVDVVNRNDGKKLGSGYLEMTGP